jgi:uncharacterized protein YjiS (DUF1127 family)
MPFYGSLVPQSRVLPMRGWRAWLARWREARAARRRLRDCLAADLRFARDIGLTAEEIGVETVRPFWKEIRRR